MSREINRSKYITEHMSREIQLHGYILYSRVFYNQYCSAAKLPHRINYILNYPEQATLQRRCADNFENN